jgi:hypothetical protein
MEIGPNDQVRRNVDNLAERQAPGIEPKQSKAEPMHKHSCHRAIHLPSSQDKSNDMHLSLILLILLILSNSLTQ